MKILPILILTILLTQIKTTINPDTDQPLVHMSKKIFATSIRDISLRKSMLLVFDISVQEFHKHETDLWLKLDLNSRTTLPEDAVYQYLVFSDPIYNQKEFRLADSPTKASQAIATGKIDGQIFSNQKNHLPHKINWLKINAEDLKQTQSLYVFIYDVEQTIVYESFGKKDRFRVELNIFRAELYN